MKTFTFLSLVILCQALSSCLASLWSPYRFRGVSGYGCSFRRRYLPGRARPARPTRVSCELKHLNSSGSFTSPGFPRNYPENYDCQWKISTTEGKVINLRFSAFSLEDAGNCKYDYLDVYDGDSANAKRLGRFCGNQIPRKLVSSGSNMFIVFHTDGSVQQRGFALQYSSSYGCDRELTERAGEIMYPTFLNEYPQPIPCHYRIKVAGKWTIRLNFEGFKLEHASANGCEHDYIEVYDGPTDKSPKLGKYCGEAKPVVRRSSGSQLLIRFNHSNATAPRMRFRIKYYAEDVNECLVNNGGCDHYCNNTDGGFSCSCRPGYQKHHWNTSRCLDVNECALNNGGCSQICTNTQGSYECGCKPVYKLAPDGKTCNPCVMCEKFETMSNIIEQLQMEVKALQVALKRTECRYNEKTYKNSDEWMDGECRSCSCQDGQVTCFQDKECFQGAF